MRSCYEQIGGVKHSSAFVSGWILVDSDSSNAIYWVTKHHYKSQEVGFHHTQGMPTKRWTTWKNRVWVEMLCIKGNPVFVQSCCSATPLFWSG